MKHIRFLSAENRSTLDVQLEKQIYERLVAVIALIFALVVRADHAHGWATGPGTGALSLTQLSNYLTLMKGSFSAVSKPIFIRK